jgi:Pyruvate/2-oxoacid:ferredoxin oxidoreductase gamma subunit
VYKDISATAVAKVPHEEVKDAKRIFEILGLQTGADAKVEKHSIGPERRLKIAGFGGQGALTAGAVIATAGMNDGLQVTWLPSYGPEMRGGTANCSVILSDKRIGLPLVKNPSALVALNRPSLDAFEKTVVPGGFIIVNSSIIDRKVERSDVHVVYAPLTEIAVGLGLKAAATSVALGVYLALDPVLDLARISEVFHTSFKKKALADINIQAVRAGMDFVKNASDQDRH